MSVIVNSINPGSDEAPASAAIWFKASPDS